MEQILLAHGGGGEETRELIEGIFRRYLSNPFLDRFEDSAVLDIPDGGIAFTTDSFTVSPLFFNGGNIGKLAVAGTVNDLSVMGARPLFLSAGFIIEEGFLIEDLERILQGMHEETEKTGVMVVTGDTKIMPRGQLNGVIINTSGIGKLLYRGLSASNLNVEDGIIVTGTVGDHGACILAEREGMGFELDIPSDCASLWEILKEVLDSGAEIHAMRDPTRGGLAAVLNEWATASGTEIEILEHEIPVEGSVRGICELLGMETTHLASEGRAVIAVKNGDEGTVLDSLRNHPLGKGARLIGSVTDRGKKRVILRSPYNTRRIMEPPSGELLPRIC